MASRPSPSAIAAAVCLALVVCSGCGSKGAVPVAARISMGGEPVVEATVTFVRADGEQGRAGFGITDDQGVARITTFEPFDGVMPGSYSVVVVKPPENMAAMRMSKEEQGSGEAMLRMSAMASAGPPRRQFRLTLLPEVYSDPGTTPLKCNVDGSNEEVAFELEGDQ